MAKTATDAFNDNQIAKGHDNYSGLGNIELILVDRDYFPRVHDFPFYREGVDRVTGDGITRGDGNDTTQWLSNGITDAQWWYLYTSILGGARSGKVTFKTRRWAATVNTTMPELYIIANAILDIGAPPDLNRAPLGYDQFVYNFSKISILHEDKMKGTLSVTGASTAQNGVTTAAEKLIAFTTSGLNAGVTTSASDDSHTIDIAEDYTLEAVISFTAEVSVKWSFQFYVDAAAVGPLFITETNATPDAEFVAMKWQQALDATAVVTVYVKSDEGGGKNITVTDAVFTVESN